MASATGSNMEHNRRFHLSNEIVQLRDPDTMEKRLHFVPVTPFVAAVLHVSHRAMEVDSL